MASAKTIAAQMGVTTGTMSSEEFFVNRYTRIGAPWCVNPFSVYNGNGPSEELDPHSWSDFEGYSHTILNLGDNVTHTLVPGGATIEWTAAPGFEPDVCQYVVYWDAGLATIEPISNYPLSDRQEVGSSLSYTITTVTPGTSIGVCVVVEFDDNTNTYESTGFPGDISEDELSGDDEGIYIVSIPSIAPSISSVEQFNPNTSTCDPGTHSTTSFLVTFTDYIPGENKRLEYELNNSGSWNFLSNTITGATYEHSGISTGSVDVYRYRVRYTDEVTYSSESAPISVICGPE